MDVRADKAKIWRRDVEGRNGTFHKYTTSVSKKKEDGTFATTYLNVMFSKKSGAPEKIENGAVCSFEGFMSVESYTDKEGRTRSNPLIIIMKADFEGGNVDADGFQQATEDIPF